MINNTDQVQSSTKSVPEAIKILKHHGIVWNTGAVRQRLPPQEKPALKTQYDV